MPRRMFESDDDYEKRLHKEAKNNSKAKRELDKLRRSPRGFGRPGRVRGRGVSPSNASKPKLWRGGSRGGAKW